VLISGGAAGVSGVGLQLELGVGVGVNSPGPNLRVFPQFDGDRDWHLVDD